MHTEQVINRIKRKLPLTSKKSRQIYVRRRYVCFRQCHLIYEKQRKRGEKENRKIIALSYFLRCHSQRLSYFTPPPPSFSSRLIHLFFFLLPSSFIHQIPSFQLFLTLFHSRAFSGILLVPDWESSLVVSLKISWVLQLQSCHIAVILPC